jgi:hypothetical protein
MTDILPVVNKEELQKINNQKVTELEKIASDMPQVFLQTESIIFGSMYFFMHVFNIINNHV